MRHAVLGAGGVGGLIGACLAHSGHLVTLVVRPEAQSIHPPKLKIESTFGNWSVDVEWSSSVPAADVLWLAVKAPQLGAAMQLIAEANYTGAIVPLLNGIDHVALLRSQFGDDRVVPATIAGETEKVGVGHIVHRSPFEALNISARGRNLLQGVVDQLQAIGFICKFFEDETTLMWSKLVMLAPFALTTSAFDKTIGEVMSNPGQLEQLETCVREACAAGNAEGAAIDVEKVLKTMRTFPPAMRSSMQKDVENGRPPELDAIGGAVLRASMRHGLKAPATEELMKEVERRIVER